MHTLDKKHKQSTCRRLLKTKKRCFLVVVLLVAVSSVIYLLDVTFAARPHFTLQFQTLWMTTILGTRVSPTSPFSTTTTTTTITTTTTTPTTTTTSATTTSIIVNTTKEPRKGTLVKVNTKPCDDANITAVSAFFDLGTYKKGFHEVRGPKEYYSWGKAWAKIQSRLVFYTDSKDFADRISKIRSDLHPSLTHVIRVDRSSLWSFRLRDDIARLYASPAYPKHHPNTVIAEYTCVQHSKYAIIMDVIKNRREIPASRVYAWIDVGYYRNPENMNYCLKLPSDFDEKMPSYNQVFSPNFQHFPKDIFYDNHVWVGGGMFIATRNTMITLCNEYQRATRYLLYNMSLSSTDQQCLYASFTNDGRRNIRFGLELNVRPGGHDWFELGYQCLHELKN